MTDIMGPNNYPATSVELLYFTHCITRLANAQSIEREELLSTIESAVTLLETDRHDMAGHSSEVAYIALFISRKLGMSGSEQNKLRLAAILHDIGKIVMNNPLDQHAKLGAEIIRCNPHLNETADMVLFHHTCWKGKSSSEQPTQNDIPLGARIIAVADAFQRYFSHRQCLDDIQILRELRIRAGSCFDPKIVDIVIEHHKLLSNYVFFRHPDHIWQRNPNICF